MQLSTKIEKLRKKKGWSQEELADAVGVSRQSVFKWESGVNTPDIDKMKKLVSIFNVSYDVLLNDNIELDDDLHVIEHKEEKPKKKINKKFIFIPLAIVLGISVITASSILIVRGVQHAQRVQENKRIEKENQEKIDYVINLINGIGDVTLESEPKIIKAEKAYNSLADNLKDNVTNYNVLVKARETYEELAYQYREEITKDDPTRDIVLSDLNGEWHSDDEIVWKIQDVAGKSSVLYWTSTDPNGSAISANLKNSVLVGYNNLTMKMEFKLYHYYSFGEEFLDVSMKRYSDSPNGFTLYFEDIVFTKKA